MDVPATVPVPLGSATYTFVVVHDPVKSSVREQTNYAHSEVRTFKNGRAYDVKIDIAKSAKLEFRARLRDAIVLLRRPKI